MATIKVKSRVYKPGQDIQNESVDFTTADIPKHTSFLSDSVQDQTSVMEQQKKPVKKVTSVVAAPKKKVRVKSAPKKRNMQEMVDEMDAGRGQQYIAPEGQKVVSVKKRSSVSGTY